MKILLVVPGKKGFSTESFQSLGIGMIAAVLQCEGHTVQVLDLTVHALSVTEFGLQVKHCAPDLIGFTVSTPTADLVYHTLVPAAYANAQAKLDLAKKELVDLQQQMASLQGNVSSDQNQLMNDIQEIRITPSKRDIVIKVFGLAWIVS